MQDQSPAVSVPAPQEHPGVAREAPAAMLYPEQGVGSPLQPAGTHAVLPGCDLLEQMALKPAQPSGLCPDAGPARDIPSLAREGPAVFAQPGPEPHEAIIPLVVPGL